LNVIDRRSRRITIKKLENKEKITVKEAIERIFEGRKVYSITVDNGIEFTDVIDICKRLRIK